MSIQDRFVHNFKWAVLHKLGGEITTNRPGLLTRRGENEKAQQESEFAVKSTSCQVSQKKKGGV